MDLSPTGDLLKTEDRIIPQLFLAICDHRVVLRQSTRIDHHLEYEEVVTSPVVDPVNKQAKDADVDRKVCSFLALW